jgi:ribosomal protein S18 acetylase RimI-like enzyme
LCDCPQGCFAEKLDAPHVPARIGDLFVAPEFRRLGIAKTLMERALEWLRDSGAVSQRVTVLHANDEALAFYRRFGFEVRSVELEQLSKTRHA